MAKKKTKSYPESFRREAVQLADRRAQKGARLLKKSDGVL
jgi:hypothetical protein